MSPFPLSGGAWRRDPVTGALTPEPSPTAPAETPAPEAPAIPEPAPEADTTQSEETPSWP